ASGVPNKEKVGKVTKQQIKEIVQIKFKDLNTTEMENAMKIVEGTARSMGIDVTE
ncbi:MAG: 50S ribosomal protein L11, partial [Candidatus Omnitrophica bacterium]|nr:50S ribosomal protein L11 [Candidatus Omnitrophota bacterium]